MDHLSGKRHVILARGFLLGLLCWISFIPELCAFSQANLSLWVNEVIIAAYTTSADDLLNNQKELAQYFTTQGWIDYTKALDVSNLRESIKNNHYHVSAVAILPPTIKEIQAGTEWHATMPVIVLYKNEDHQQKQTLEAVVTFLKAKPNEGVRGLAVTSFTTTVSKAPCQCARSTKIQTVV